MITVEINAIQRAKHLEISADEGITVQKLTESIGNIVGDDVPGCIVSGDLGGILPVNAGLAELGMVTGMVLIYISKTGHGRETE